jgi:hypothetical protein
MTWPKEANQASIATAIQEQLGLKRESQKIPMEVLVIDHIEKPPLQTGRQKASLDMRLASKVIISWKGQTG